MEDPGFMMMNWHRQRGEHRLKYKGKVHRTQGTTITAGLAVACRLRSWQACRQGA